MGVARATRTAAAAVKLTAPFVVIALAVSLEHPTDGAPIPGTRPVAASALAAIDRPSSDQYVPKDAAVNVRSFGARGDGRTDDTRAIQRAISSSVGLLGNRKVLYFPKGTYKVSRPLLWKDTTGRWATTLTLIGQNRDRTIIRLADGAKGFGNRSAPRAVIVTASQNATATGEGNQAFGNFLFDLTVDVGRRNPGAVGIDYLANNRGAIRNVVVRAPAGSGAIGISMQRRWPGPCLLQDVAVRGFSKGIVVGNWEYSVTLENLRLTGQRTVGVDVLNNVATIRRLVSRNKVPAVRNGAHGTRDGLVSIVESTLLGGARNRPAIDNSARIYVSRVTSTGYGALVRDNGTMRRLSPMGTYASAGTGRRLTVVPTGALGMTVREAPATPDVPASGWASVDRYGAVRDDWADDSAAIQRALDSGKPVVYFHAGLYVVKHALVVPDTVQAIIGFEATVQANGGAFTTGPDDAIFSVPGRTTTPLLVSHISFRAWPLSVIDVKRTGTRPLHLRDMHVGGVPLKAGPGDIYLTNVEGGAVGWSFHSGQRVWARQLNAEQWGTKITNAGGDLWILGLKTEAPGTAVRTVGGGRTRVLGALLYPVWATDGAPAFENRNSEQAVTAAVSAVTADRAYKVLTRDVCRTSSTSVRPGAGLRRGGFGAAVVMHQRRC